MSAPSWRTEKAGLDRTQPGLTDHTDSPSISIARERTFVSVRQRATTGLDATRMSEPQCMLERVRANLEADVPTEVT